MTLQGAGKSSDEVRVIRNQLIPLGDGTLLGADLFLPARTPCPVLVVYFPYHKDDCFGGVFDYPNRFFARHGYASLQVDLRGTGNSDGIPWEMGDTREGEDGADIVEWAAGQSWCDGSVGMWGMSYSAITTLATAAVGPPHLKAVAPIMGGLNQYHDIFYPGGCPTLLCMDGGWGPFMVAMDLVPPMYHDPEGRWERIWRERLGRARRPYVLPPREHPEYDDYWQAKGIDATRITAPTFLVGAWHDVFPDSIVRAYQLVRGPRRLLMGPWMHEMPDTAGVEPVDYVAELLRWWDGWLKGIDNGVREEPSVTIYVQGEGWRREQEWPIARSTETVLHLVVDTESPSTLQSSPSASAGTVSYCGDPTVGVTAGLWDPTGTGLGRPLDQNPDDLRSITFTSAALEDDLEISGSPETTLFVSLEEGDQFNLVAKLCDVGPDGRSQLITAGSIRVNHGSNEQPHARGEAGSFSVPLTVTSYRMAAGHRIRLSVSCADFPRIWPTARNPTIGIHSGGDRQSRLCLPVVPGLDSPDRTPPMAPPHADRNPFEVEVQPRYEIQYAPGLERASVTFGTREEVVTPSRDGCFRLERVAHASVSRGRPQDARLEGEAVISAQASGGPLIIVTGRVSETMNGQDASASVTVDGALLFQHDWHSPRPR